MAYGLDKEVFEARSESYCREFRMEKRLNWFPAHFSKGMRQKVMIMCAFLVNPSLYIIDEPFVGLDPIGIKSLLEQMTERKEKGLPFLCRRMFCQQRKNIVTESFCCTKDECGRKERWMI